jgi:hypothetical protein
VIGVGLTGGGPSGGGAAGGATTGSATIDHRDRTTSPTSIGTTRCSVPAASRRAARNSGPRSPPLTTSTGPASSSPAIG